MTAQTVKHNLVFSCDGCPETYEPESNEFSVGWAEARGKGWVAVPVKGGWGHYCPGCASDS